MPTFQEELLAQSDIQQTPLGSPINYEIIPSWPNLIEQYPTQLPVSLKQVYLELCEHYGINHERQYDRLVWLRSELRKQERRGVQFAAVTEQVWVDLLKTLKEIGSDPEWKVNATNPNVRQAALSLLVQTLGTQVVIVNLPNSKGEFGCHAKHWIGIANRDARRIMGYLVDKSNYYLQSSSSLATNLDEPSGDAVRAPRNERANYLDDGLVISNTANLRGLLFGLATQPDLILNAGEGYLQSSSFQQSFKSLDLTSQDGVKLNPDTRSHPPTALLPYRPLMEAIGAYWPEELKKLPEVIKQIPGALTALSIQRNFGSAADRLLSDPATQSKLLKE